MKNGQKCDAKCDAIHNIWLRNGIYYYRVELSRQNGKRRYFRQSLHTGNYYEAREKVLFMQQNSVLSKNQALFAELRRYLNQIVFEPIVSLPGGIIGLGTEIKPKRKISQKTPVDAVAGAIEISHKLEKIEQKGGLSDEERQTVNELRAILPELQEFLKLKDPLKAFLANMNAGTPVASITPIPKKPISEILDSMLMTAANGKTETLRKRNTITRLIESVGLSLDSDYMDFYKADIIQKIGVNIQQTADVKGDTKRKYLRYIKDLITQANIIDPDNYKTNLLNCFPKIKKTSKSEQQPHLPYTDEQLLKIFDPKHNYFQENPDDYWVCLIGLFTGARITAAITLQYENIITQDGIHCIKYVKDHEYKDFKNEATVRAVPIPKQLLDAGFVKYVEKKRKELSPKGADFIFPKCETSNKTKNNKFTRQLFAFFERIGVKQSGEEKHDFHSFRKNASVCLQTAGVPTSYINKIIGWEGTGTMEQSYSNLTLKQIKPMADKCRYPFLQPHFDKWREIMLESDK